MNIAGLCNVEIHRAVASQKTRIMCHASIVNFTIARTSQSSNILRIFCHFMSSCFSFFPVKSPKKSFLRYTSKWLSAPCCREQECFNSVKPIQFEIWSVKHSSTTKAKSSPTGKKEYLGTGSVTDSRCTTGLHRLSPALLLPSAPSFLPSLMSSSAFAASWQMSPSLSVTPVICSYGFGDLNTWLEWP